MRFTRVLGPPLMVQRRVLLVSLLLYESGDIYFDSLTNRALLEILITKWLVTKAYALALAGHSYPEVVVRFQSEF